MSWVTSLLLLSLSVGDMTNHARTMPHGSTTPSLVSKPVAAPAWPLRWAVTGGGLALIGLELWWFLGKPHQKVTAMRLGDRPPGTGKANRQQVKIQVQGGYRPDTILVQAGHPLTLTFERSDSNDCLAEVQFPDFGLRQPLPLGQPVRIDLPPLAAGEYSFACGMNMFRGRIIAQP